MKWASKIPRGRTAQGDSRRNMVSPAWVKHPPPWNNLQTAWLEKATNQTTGVVVEHNADKLILTGWIKVLFGKELQHAKLIALKLRQVIRSRG